KLYPRYEVVMRFLDLDDRLGETDLVITAEGAVDFQTPRGKIPAEVADRARKYGVPVIALAGTLGRDYQLNYEHGIAAMASILVAPVSLAEAIENAGPLLEDCAERVVRLICVGQQLGQRTG
ncbi:MAG: glycerate kinase, partial [Chloroflexia bacterium]